MVDFNSFMLCVPQKVYVLLSPSPPLAPPHFNPFKLKGVSHNQIHSGPNDRRVMAKHSEIYPSAEELDAVQTIVSHVECALKALSEKMDASNKGAQETKR